jgi:4-hydroxy-tetrahydrodipicolinate synthase
MMDHFLAGENREAAAIHRRLIPLVDMAFVDANPIPIKFMLNQAGFNAGPNRLPLVEPDEATASRILAELRKHRIDLPVAV